MIELTGSPAQLAPFLHEAGGHRWQRVPATEKHGRVHTSTVTVAVLPVQDERDYRLRDADLEVFTQRGSGPGGQHRNRTESCVVMRHRPTGLQARADARSQHDSRRQARRVLEARVAAFYGEREALGRAEERRQQVGSGERGAKLRTYRTADDRVLDERSGRKASLRQVRVRGLQAVWD